MKSMIAVGVGSMLAGFILGKVTKKKSQKKVKK
jgi:hypothetical protein